MSRWKLKLAYRDGDVHAAFKAGYTSGLTLVRLGPAGKPELLRAYPEKAVSVAATM